MVLLVLRKIKAINYVYLCRTARTFAGGESVGMIDLYDVNREELRIGPFRYKQKNIYM